MDGFSYALTQYSKEDHTVVFVGNPIVSDPAFSVTETLFNYTDIDPKE